MDGNNIKLASAKVLLGIIGFVLIYVALLVGSGLMCYYIYPYWLDEVSESTSWLWTIFISVLLWIAPAIFIVNLLMFVFDFQRDKRNDRLEIDENSCPMLFDMIKELVKEEKCQMPKKVFLSPDVNACVFYNTSFWNIFLPVRKNLEIGLGLLACTSIDEVKGILAHEFGHFSQRSMKVGSAISVSNQIISNLAYNNGLWDKFVAVAMNICRFNVYIWLLVIVVFGITIGMKKLLQFLCKQTNKVYYELSRQMEYEADHIAASIVGAKTFASALRKTDYTAQTYQTTIQLAGNLLEQKNGKVRDMFKFHDTVSLVLSEMQNLEISASSPLTESLIKDEINSRIVTKNVWDDHPSLTDRIKNLPQTKIVEGTNESSFVLIPENIRFQLTDIMYSVTIGKRENASFIEEITQKDWIRQELEENIIQIGYEEFVNHEIGPFKINIDHFEEVDNPFNDENRKMLKEYGVALNDLKTLEAIETGEFEVKEIRYNGILYEKESLPTEEHRRIVNKLVGNVNEIDYCVLQYIYINASTENKERLISLYLAMFDLQKYLGEDKESVQKSLNTLLNGSFEDDEDRETSVDFAKINISSYIKKGCSFLSAFGNYEAEKYYMDIAENYESYNVNGLINVSNSLCNNVDHYQHRLRINLSKLMKAADKQ